MFDDDLIGWQLDDVLEDFEVDYAIENGIAIDATGEPRDPMMDGDVRDRLDRADNLHDAMCPLCACAACRAEDMAA